MESPRRPRFSSNIEESAGAGGGAVAGPQNAWISSEREGMLSEAHRPPPPEATSSDTITPISSEIEIADDFPKFPPPLPPPPDLRVAGAPDSLFSLFAHAPGPAPLPSATEPGSPFLAPTVRPPRPVPVAARLARLGVLAVLGIAAGVSVAVASVYVFGRYRDPRAAHHVSPPPSVAASLAARTPSPPAPPEAALAISAPSAGSPAASASHAPPSSSAPPPPPPRSSVGTPRRAQRRAPGR
jgi:hypothetical protein